MDDGDDVEWVQVGRGRGSRARSHELRLCVRRGLPSLCGNNKLLSVLLLLLLSSQVFWQRATSDSDLINSEVGLTAKHQASGPLGLPDDAAE